MNFDLLRRVASEFLGTAFLLAVVVGSGIMGERLANGNAAVALLANAVATGAGLVFLILTFGGISGAHLNPAVTIAAAWDKFLPWRETPLYIVSQTAGALAGVAAANYMFELPVFFASTKIRAGEAQFFSEFLATFGLLAVIQAGIKFKPEFLPFTVAAYITSAYWFTSSTSFANPAVTIARAFTDTFAGICPANVPAFVVAQISGAAASVAVFGWLLKEEKIDER